MEFEVTRMSQSKSLIQHAPGSLAEADRFTALDFLRAQRAAGHEIVSIINLANTEKYYSWDAAAAERAG
jgi:hypothetical protein